MKITKKSETIEKLILGESLSFHLYRVTCSVSCSHALLEPFTVTRLVRRKSHSTLFTARIIFLPDLTIFGQSD